MFAYKVAYRLRMGTFFAEVLDFPDVTAFGPSVAVARAGILSALRYNAERRLSRGEYLPLPEPGRMAPDAYAVELVTVLPYDNNRVEVQTTVQTA
jgi:predicted RNase H-like HicB family nuclease